MVKNTHRVSIVGVVIVCFVAAQLNVTLFASENTGVSTDAFASVSSDTASETVTDLVSTLSPQTSGLRLPTGADLLAANSSPRTSFKLDLEPTPSSAFAGQIYQGRPYRMSRSGSIAALMIGAAAAITGAAILVYANRPECATNQFAGGCGYGTKVVGGAVLAGGVVGLFVGALTWR